MGTLRIEASVSAPVQSVEPTSKPEMTPAGPSDRFDTIPAPAAAQYGDRIALLLELAVLRPTGEVAREIELAPEFADYLELRGIDPAGFRDATRRQQIGWLRSFVSSYVADHGPDDPLVRAMHRELARQWLQSEMAHTSLDAATRRRLANAHWSETIAVIRRQLVTQLDLLTGRALTSEQGQSLSGSLRRHGVAAANGYATLRRLSRSNVLRLRGDEALDGLPAGMRDRIERAAHDLTFVYVHATRHLEELPETPLMSSRRIEKLSASGGANSHVFNKRFLGSDDNVYFRLYYGHRARPPVFDPNEYGDAALVARPGFVHRAGWVSAFVMFPKDLQDAADALEVAGLTAEPVDFDPAREAPGGLWHVARERLHCLDFTVPDFEQLVRSWLRQTLADLHRAGGLEDALATLERGSADEIQAFMEEQVLGPRTLPRYWELKIPVAVPPSEISAIPSTR